MKTEKLPPWYVARKALLEETKTRLLGASRRGAVLWGMGGSGKTVLARAISLDEEVRNRFQGGILWACLGDRPVVEWLWDWLSLLRLEAGPYESELLLGERVRQHLAARPEPLLVILDGVWRMSDVCNLLVDGEKDRLLIATRNYGVVSRLGMEGEAIRVVKMHRNESLELLRVQVGKALWDREWADAFAELVGDLPLALEISAARVVRRRARGCRAWSDLLGKLRDGHNILDVLRLPGAEQRQESLRATLDASYDDLDEAGRLLLPGLTACCLGGRFSVEDAARVAGEERERWHLEDALWDLVDRSWLLECTGANGESQFCFHRLVRQYVIERSRREAECGG
jgi:hypothetical protein